MPDEAVRREGPRSRALVVEDEMIVARDLQEILERLGYEVCGIARSADEALHLAKLHEPDFALLDVVLEGAQDGVSLAVDLRRHLTGPLLFVTSHADRTTVARAMAVRPEGYVVKPFTSDDVFVAVELALSQRATPHAVDAAALVEATDAQGGLRPDGLSRVLQHIERNFHRPLTLAELAALVGLTPDHFGRLFKQSTGQTPHQAVIAARMDEAAALVRETALPLGEIARRVGYETQAAFQTAFKRHVGVSPGAYRQA